MPWPLHKPTRPSDLSHFSYPLAISHAEATPPTRTLYQLHLDLCEALEQQPRLPESEQCPRGTRGCLRVLNAKQGESDRVTMVVPVVAPEDAPSRARAKAERSTGERTESGRRVIAGIKWSAKEGSRSSASNDEHDWRLELYGAAHYGGGGVEERAASGELGTRAEASEGRRQKTIIDMHCDPSAAAPDTAPVWRHYDAREGELKLSWTSKYACSTEVSGGAGGGDTSPPSNGGGSSPSASSGGSGFFSWFFFLLFLAFGLYFSLGTYRNYSQFGIVEIPHKEFWREAPYLAKDLGQQLFRTIGSRGGAGGGGGAGRGDYEAL